MTATGVAVLTVKTRVFWGLLTSVILAISIAYFWADRNPDWDGYMRIYDNGGAWLSASSRDSVFLFFISIFQTQPIFPANYEAFRIALAAVFVYFTFRFMSGKVHYFQQSHSVFVLLPFLSLILLRGTIQVREGLAVVLLILALKMLLLPKARRVRTKITRVLLAGALVYLSVGTHIVGSIGFAILMLSLWTMKLTNKVPASIEFVFTPLLGTIFFLFGFQFGVFDIGILFAERLSGDRDVVEGGVSFSAMIVWGIFIVLNFIMWFSTFLPTSDRSRQAAVLQALARNLAGPAAISSGVFVLILKFTFVSPVVTVLIVRTAEFSSAFAAVLITALYGRRYSPIILATFLLLKTYTQLNADGF